MANAAAGTVWNVPNYVGPLFLVGANQTPFLNMAGGMTGGRQVDSWEFALAQTYALESAAQPAITETQSLTAPTAVSYVRSQDVNTVQIFQKQVSLSYAKQSNKGTISGIAITGQTQPVGNEKDFQIASALKQLAIDVEYTFLNGAYQKATSASVAAKTRGIIAACSTNTVAAGSTALTKTHVDSLLRAMASNGAQFGNMVLFANAFNVNRISSQYGYAPTDRTVGGVAVKTILTDFCTLSVVWAPFMPTTTVLVADMSAVSPVFLPVPSKGYVFYEELARTGAAEQGQLYGQIGLDYGPEEFHGTITGTTSS